MDKAARAALLTAKGMDKKRDGYALFGGVRPKPVVKNPMLQEAYFAGPKAKTFAEAPEAHKFTTPDEVTRFEQPDNEAASNIKTAEQYEALRTTPKVVSTNPHNDKVYPAGVRTLGDLYQHPTLYKDYPELFNAPVYMNPIDAHTGVDGAFADQRSVVKGQLTDLMKANGIPLEMYNSKTGAFVLSPNFVQDYNNSGGIAAYIRKILGHETQHWIDNYEETDMYGTGRTRTGIGAAPYMDRPTEATAYYTEDRMDATPEERYGNIQGVSDYLRDNADWAGEIGKSKGGALDLARAVMAKDRAGGQIAPSKYLPNVPRQVHAGGGKVAFQQGNHPDVPEVLYHGNAPKIVEDHKYHGDGKWTSDIDQEATNKNIAAQDFRTFRPSEYGSYGAGIYLSDSPNVASDYAQGIRADQADAKPHGQVMKLHVSMKQPFTDDTLRHPAWRDHIKDAIKQGLWLGGINDEDKARAAELTKKLDDGTATVRDLFLTDTQHGAMVNQFGQQNIHKTIRNSGFDGIIAHRPDGSKEYVAFKPEQIKSAIGNQGTFDPNDPDITKSGGGSVTDTDEFRNWFGNSATHTDGDPHVLYTGTSKDKDFTSFNVGRHGTWFTRDPAEASQYAEQNDSQGYKHEAGWKLTPTNTASRVIPAYVKAENPYTGDLPDEVLRSNYKAAQSDWFDTLRRKGHDAWIPARHNGDLVVALKEPQQIKSIFNNGKFDPNQKHMNKADGGRIGKAKGGPMGDNRMNFIAGNHPEVPPVVYHGTLNDFNQFHPLSHFGTNDAAHERISGGSKANQGYWDAEGRLSRQVMPVHISMKNPIDVGKEWGWINDWHMLGQVSARLREMSGGDSNHQYSRAADQLDSITNNLERERHPIAYKRQAASVIRSTGHDGIIYTNDVEDTGNRSFVTLHPHQVKSAIGNNGNFDPLNPDMTKSEGGTVGKEEGGATGSLREKGLWPSAQEIKAGTGSREAHAELVNKIKPVSPYAAPVPPASDQQVHDALTKDKQPKAFAPRGLEEGTPVAVRLDIPAYEKKNTWVVSVHHPKTDFTAGEVIGYDSVAHIGNPRFGVHPTGALNIASGKPKSTIATVHGNWKKTTPEDAFKLSQTVHNDPQWRQVGMDPERHSYFYDRETQEPVMAADEALHIGPLVYAKNPVYGKKTDFAFSSGGMIGKEEGGKVEQMEQPANGMHMLRMRRAGINTKEDFWNRWRDRMKATALPNTNLSAIGSKDGHFQQIDKLINFHRQDADANGIRSVLQNYGRIGPDRAKVHTLEDGSMAAALPKAILQGAGIEPTIDNASQIYHSLPDDESGRVGKAGGGEMDGVESNNQNGVSNVGTQIEAGAAPFNPAPRAQAGELRDAGRVRGGSGVLQAPDEAPLEGLLTPVTIPMTGQVIHAAPAPHVRQVARDYMASTGLPYNPPKKYAKADPTRALRISDAYEAMKDDASDPLTKASYAAMIKETMAQYHAAKAAGFKVEFWDPQTQEDPYHASPRLATEDIKNNNHMFVFPTDSGYGSDGPITEEQIKNNPMLQDSGETWNGQPVTVNDIFRAVHDYFGHAKEGVGFRADGEENAWRSHAAMYSPLARMAMTSETRGQNSWLNFNPVSGERNRKARTENSTFADQKVGILPHWVHHEGAEDFMGPEDVNAMAAIRKIHGKAGGGAVDKALALTRGFSKDGKAATMALKPKGK